MQDIIIYLQPEANGLRVESTVLRAIRSYPAAEDVLNIVYMANLPGDFIIKNRIVEQHYALKIRFAREGKAVFTKAMRRRFESYFKTSFDLAEVVGAFQAKERLGLSAEKLFRHWVPGEEFTKIHRQSIKKIGKLYVVNYDVPALLKKNSSDTNIFVLILRSFLSFRRNHDLMDRIFRALADQEIVTDRMPLSYILHYSKGPFEQILDGLGYIYTEQDRRVSLGDLSFFGYLFECGCRETDVLAALHQPIMTFRTEKGPVERHLFDYTYEDSFERAFDKFQTRLPVS